MQITSYDANRYDEILACCEEKDHLLNDWESGFVDSLQIQLAKDRPLTAKQRTRLEELAEKVGYV